MEVISLKTKEYVRYTVHFKSIKLEHAPKYTRGAIVNIATPSLVAGNHTLSTNWDLTAFLSFTTAASAALRSVSLPIFSLVRGGGRSECPGAAGQPVRFREAIDQTQDDAREPEPERDFEVLCARCGVNVRNFICWACGYVLDRLGEYISCECEGEWTHPDERVETQIPRIT